VARTPHATQTRVTIRYSVTRGAGGGDTSTTWRRCTPTTGAPARSAPQPPQQPGLPVMISLGASTSGIVVPGSPGCLPGWRPEDFREERRTGLRYGESELGGLLDVEESLPNCRSSAVIRAFCASTTSRSAALSRRSSQTSAHSCPTDDPAGTGGSSDTNHHDQHTHTMIKPTRRTHTTTDPHSLPARQVVNSYRR
jgi:hypothetical protein